MFPIRLKILETAPPDVTVRNWRSIRRGTYRAMGEHWYANMLPKHFESGANFVYGYRRRTAKYLERLKRGGRGIHPAAATMALTKSGLLQTAMTARGKVIREFPTRFTVTMPGLPYTPSKQRTARQPFLQGEVTKLLRREIAVLKRVGKDEAVRLLASVRETRTTQVQ